MPLNNRSSYSINNKRRSNAYDWSRSRNRHSNRRNFNSSYIDPTKFVRLAKNLNDKQDQYIARYNFSDFSIADIIKNNLKLKGYTTPTPIQDDAIPLGINGKDIIGIANTGTGKTIAFAIPIINKLISEKESRALIIAPTRELAQQIEEECRVIGRGAGFNGALLIGGANIVPQLRDLRLKPKLVIGTPGRIKDHIERNTLNLHDFNTVVLDEVDRMLDMGFVDDVKQILSELADIRQSFFFSATLDERVKSLIETFSNSPITLSMKTSETSDYVNQDVVHYKTQNDKLEMLHEILINNQVSKAIVFDETQRNVENLGNELISRGFKADAIHGGKSQGQRQRALKRFKTNEINILVATDVAARGIDVADISHVINYSIPQNYDSYVHRIGRAGRAGKLGYALTFIAN